MMLASVEDVVAVFAEQPVITVVAYGDVVTAPPKDALRDARPPTYRIILLTRLASRTKLS
jgi:hypothetical protein